MEGIASYDLSQAHLAGAAESEGEVSKHRHKLLNCRVTRDGTLRIEIGVEALAFATLHSGHVWGWYGDDGTEPTNRFRISNAKSFALDVRAALLDEAEDGSNILTRAIDAATEKAIDDGSEHFVDLQEDK